MFAALGRLIAVAFGLMAAVAVGVFVAVQLGLERVTGALHANDDPLASMLQWLWYGAHLSIYTTSVLAILVVITGEVARIRPALFYIVGGGIAAAAGPLLIQMQRANGADALPAFVWQVFATAGFAGGAVYWLIAGRRA